MPIKRSTHIDEGPVGWEAGSGDLTRRDRGMFDPKELVKLPGRKNEQELFKRSPTGRMKPDEWQEFVADIKKNGVQNTVTVHRDQDGRAVIHEGNHRLRAAIEAGVKVPAEISYFGNSQRRGLIAEALPEQEQKAPAMAIQTGRRGGKFSITATGRRVYRAS